LVAIVPCPSCSARDAAAPNIAAGSDDAISLGVHAGLRSIISAGLLAELRRPDFASVREAAAKLYSRSRYSPLWIRDGRPTAQAHAMVAQFQQAALKGLDPTNYYAPRWNALEAALGGGEERNSIRAEVTFDAALTVCSLRLISDLHVGRVNPHHSKFVFESGGRDYDLAEYVRDRILHSSDIASAIREIEPHYRGYARAEAVLPAYLKLATEGDTAPVPAPREPLRPGNSYPGLPQLAARLRQLGDLPAAAAIAGTQYQGAIVNAVKHFQARHGLAPDGVLTTVVIAALNVPLHHRVQQLDLTLERYRWLPPDFPQPPIVVNIAEFRLRTMRQQTAPVISMRVVVGQAHGWQTPVFADYMSYLVFHPYWYVPLNIQQKDLVPRIRRDPNYLAKNGFEILHPAGVVLNSDEVDAAMLQSLADGSLTLRQKPGPKNALGPVIFIFPNHYEVYLHGEPDPKLFSRVRRDFSHGCVRVEDPLKLAAWVLRKNPGWSMARIRKTVRGDRTVRVDLVRRIPVLIQYSTAVVTPDGVVHFFADIYGRDSMLLNELAARQARGSFASARLDSIRPKHRCPFPFERRKPASNAGLLPWSRLKHQHSPEPGLSNQTSPAA
jgi:L,D-transpeptidase YcbB